MIQKIRSKRSKKVSSRFIYGPVPSRRLGYSLGIDPIPFKTCTYNCIYCQLGKTTYQTTKQIKYLQANEILADLKKALKHNTNIDFITLSGSGEPTLNINLGNFIKAIKKITSIPVAVITNSSLIHKKNVQQALLLADVVMPTFTTAYSKTFKKIHRPDQSITLKKVIKGLIEFRKIYPGKIWLELMLVKGYNDSKQELDALKNIVKKINPDKIQLNTVVRPPSEKYARALSLSALNRIKKMLGGNCEVVAKFRKSPNRLKSKNREKIILGYLKRRPGTLNDLSKSTGMNVNELIKNLTHLLATKKIVKRNYGGKIFYETKSHN
ncbi:MAG: radical SAM protein [bacterium]